MADYDMILRNGAQLAVPRYRAGQIVQYRVHSITTKLFTTSTTIGYDNSGPAISEGDEILSYAFTPRFADTRIAVALNTWVSGSAPLHVLAALFDGSTSAIAAIPVTISSANFAYPLSMVGDVLNTSLTPRNYSARWGVTSGTGYMLRTGALATMFSTSARTSLTMTEYYP